MNLHVGGVHGYDSSNAMVMLNVASSKGVSFGPIMSAHHVRMSSCNGAANTVLLFVFSKSFKSFINLRLVGVDMGV